jgi:predicted O-methyltransferase YrrM
VHDGEDRRRHGIVMTIKSRARSIARWLRGRRGVERVPLLAINTYEELGNQWYAPTLGGASTLSQYIVGGSVVREALMILNRLSPDQYQEYVTRFYKAGLDRFGDRWQYADLNTALLGLANAIAPATYLEIGVRRGRSLAMVASRSPRCHIVGCDLFLDHYAGMENPGPDFVRAEVKRVGFTGQLDFLVGDSHRMLPDYFRHHPDAFFDLVTVDGDHSEAGAGADLATVMPRVKIGGAVVFDDLSNPSHPELSRVWDEAVRSRSDFSVFTFSEIGFGVGVAVRHR